MVQNFLKRSAVPLVSFIGLLGLYWDIGWHIDIGRDSFFTLPHTLIYTSIVLLILYILFLALQKEHPFLTIKLFQIEIKLPLIYSICLFGAIIVLLSAVLDNFWHELFGIDITIWGPMHLLLIFGFCLVAFGGVVSTYFENLIHKKNTSWQLFICMAAFLGWGILFLSEYEFYVAQFPIMLYPILLAGITTFCFVFITTLKGKFSSMLLATLFILFRLIINYWLFIMSQFNLGGFTKTTIPMVLFSAIMVDISFKYKLPVWLTGILAACALLPPYFLFEHLNGTFILSFNESVQVVFSSVLVSLVAAYLANKLAKHMKG